MAHNPYIGAFPSAINNDRHARYSNLIQHILSTRISIFQMPFIL